jgi:hypothetical protein
MSEIVREYHNKFNTDKQNITYRLARNIVRKFIGTDIKERKPEIIGLPKNAVYVGAVNKGGQRVKISYKAMDGHMHFGECSLPMTARYIDSTAQEILMNSDPNTLDVKEDLNLARIRLSDLGLSGGESWEQVLQKAKELGLEPCPLKAIGAVRFYNATYKDGIGVHANSSDEYHFVLGMENPVVANPQLGKSSPEPRILGCRLGEFPSDPLDADWGFGVNITGVSARTYPNPDDIYDSYVGQDRWIVFSCPGIQPPDVVEQIQKGMYLEKNAEHQRAYDALVVDMKLIARELGIEKQEVIGIGNNESIVHHQYSFSEIVGDFEVDWMIKGYDAAVYLGINDQYYHLDILDTETLKKISSILSPLRQRAGGVRSTKTEALNLENRQHQRERLVIKEAKRKEKDAKFGHVLDEMDALGKIMGYQPSGEDYETRHANYLKWKEEHEKFRAQTFTDFLAMAE